MNFNLTWHMSASQSNLTRSQAGHFDWRHSEDRRFGKNVLARLATVTAAIWA
jgi:hypothetical protein